MYAIGWDEGRTPLAYLEDRENSEATRELLEIPGFEEGFAKRKNKSNRKGFSNVLRYPPELSAGVAVLRGPDDLIPTVRLPFQTLVEGLNRHDPGGKLWIVDTRPNSDSRVPTEVSGLPRAGSPSLDSRGSWSATIGSLSALSAWSGPLQFDRGRKGWLSTQPLPSPNRTCGSPASRLSSWWSHLRED